MSMWPALSLYPPLPGGAGLGLIGHNSEYPGSEVGINAFV